MREDDAECEMAGMPAAAADDDGKGAAAVGVGEED